MIFRLLRATCLGLVMTIAAGPAHAEPGSDFHPAVCALSGIPADAAARITCGTVAVPRLYEHPEAGSLSLAVAIIHPMGEALHDPVLYLQGGPGFPLLDQADYLLHQILAPRRDLILVDQRGTGRSEPHFCTGGTGALLAALAQGGPAATLGAGFESVYAACRAEILKAGAAGWFGTDVTVADMERVRAAFDIGEWNLYGVSYGTTVALAMADQHPRSIRAALLDSAYPPEPLPESRKRRFEETLALLFRLCAADAGCNGAYPALDRLYADTLRRLDEAPLAVVMPADLALPDNRMVLSAAEFEIVSFLALYEGGGWSRLPAFIAAAHDRAADQLEPLMAGLVRWFGQESLGTMLAVQCRDRPVDGQAHRGSLLDLLNAGGRICAGWPLAGPTPRIRPGLPVPTLFLSGALDPVTPPSFARQAALAIGRSANWLELPNTGHGVQHASLCGAILVWQFFRAPYRRVDDGCVETIPPLRFIEAVQTPVVAP
ncbi:MAG TPA: alpha/beta fold hydrolase [Aliidongia sp.]|nr:alpha/beta fold hydrolase [Aliidongia sp.]